MTIVRLIQKQEETPRPARLTRPEPKRRTVHKELVFGLCIATIILGLTAISAFNGGVSLEAGTFQMTLDASFADGLRLSFVSL